MGLPVPLSLIRTVSITAGVGIAESFLTAEVSTVAALSAPVPQLEIVIPTKRQAKKNEVIFFM